MSILDFMFPKPLWWATMTLLVATVWGAFAALTGSKVAVTPGDLVITGILLVVVFQLQSIGRKLAPK